MSSNFVFFDDKPKDSFARAHSKYLSPKGRRAASINEVVGLEEFCQSFDLKAFPLPMRIGLDMHGWMCGCGSPNRRGQTIHVFMSVTPRGEDELRSVARMADGTVELKTCTGIAAADVGQGNNTAAVEKVRVAVKNMVLHEVYEALMFRGDRIFDPHSDLKPDDQPF